MYEIKRPQAIEEKLGCEFLRTDPDEEDSDVCKFVDETFRHIKQSSKKFLIGKVLKRLLGLQFKSDDEIKSKAIEYVAKKILPNYK